MSTNTLHIGKKKQLVPVLRFKEFDTDKEDNQFEKYSFEDIFIFSTGKNIKQSEASPEFAIPCVRYGELYHMYNEVIDQIVNRTNLSETELTFSKGTEILLPSAGEDPLDIGSASALTIENVAIGRTINILRPKFDLLYSQIFVSYYINQQLKRKIATLAKGVSISNVYNSDLKKLEIVLPSLQEQQKIATFLSAIDQKIQQLTRKKELLESYKKGLMQQLFSGTLRFKDEEGKDYPDWEEKFYGDVFSFYPTNSFSRVNLNYESGIVKNIHYGDIHTKFSTLFNIREELVPYVNSEINTEKIKEECYCQEGDLVIADASEDYSDIGKAIELVELNNEKIIAGLHTFLARPNKAKMYIGFSGYLVQAWYIRKQIMTIAQGTKVLGLSTTRMVKLKIKIPCLQEQQKIATFLSSIDTKIQSITTQITQTQSFKKGLLQQMFV